MNISDSTYSFPFKILGKCSKPIDSKPNLDSFVHIEEYLSEESLALLRKKYVIQPGEIAPADFKMKRIFHFYVLLPHTKPMCRLELADIEFKKHVKEYPEDAITKKMSFKLVVVPSGEIHAECPQYCSLFIEIPRDAKPECALRPVKIEIQ